MAALYDAALSPVAINVAQFAMLRRIQRDQPVSLIELAKLHELDRSTMGRNVLVVEKPGLVITGAGHDMRENVVMLSDAGLAALVKA
ncbi:MarR family winged helix-turn-helix transcriptional regulator [Rhizobium sp.]|jgi:DNA-binding MarR family transcriptional regulator|uniref:MarR family winged helix-turn-helix transcriptional regulator n=1 Tax=Rhizobium sp. TaxID=391 RepID=UPI002AA9374D